MRSTTPARASDLSRLDTIAAYQGIGTPDLAAALNAELAELGDRCLAGSSSTMEWEYLVITKRKR